MYTNEKRKKAIMLFCMMAMFLFAVSISMVGLVLPEVTKEFQIPLSKTGIVTAIQNAGGMLALALCGSMADRFGKLKVITGLFSAMTVALLCCYTIYGFGQFVLAVMVLGLASSALNACISAYLADLFSEKRDYYIGLAGVLFGLGSVLGPIYVGLTGKLTGGWRGQFGAVGVVGVVTLFFFAILSGRRKKPVAKKAFVQEKAEQEKQRAARSANCPYVKEKQDTMASMLMQKRLWFYAAIGFLYMAHSSAFMAWIPTSLAVKYPADLSMGSRVMTVYWISILGGRIFSTWKADRLTFNKFMICANGIGGLGMLFAIYADGWALSCYIMGIMAEKMGFNIVLGLLGVLLLLIVPIILSNQHKGEKGNENGSCGNRDR